MGQADMSEDGLGLPKRFRQTDRVPVRHDLEPVGHALSRNEGIRDEHQGKEEDEADRSCSFWVLDHHPGARPYPCHGEGNQQAQTEGQESIGETIVDSPSNGQAGEDENENGNNFGEEVGGHPTGKNS